MQGIRNLAPQRQVIVRTTLLFYLISLLWRGYSHLLPYQLLQPPLTKMHYDLSFWLFRLTGLDALLMHTTAGAVFLSSAVIILCLLSLLFPRKTVFIIPFTLLYFLLAIASNIYLTHSAHYLGCMVWLTVAFWAVKDDNFNLMWEGVRYYACWIYASAFVWKLVNGAFFQWDAGILTFKSNLAQYLYQNPATPTAHLYYYLLQYPFIFNFGHKIIMLVEGVFILGFFTKKYDTLLILSAATIFLSTYLFSDVFFAELLAVILPLLPASVWSRLSRAMPLLNK